MTQRNIIFVDTETTALDGQVWEIAWAIDDPETVPVAFQVEHDLEGASVEALKIGRYHKRHSAAGWAPGAFDEVDLQHALKGVTLAGANPAFDAMHLRKRWGVEPWHYRLLDVCAYSMGALGLDYVPGLYEAAERLDVELPDHTAAADVVAARAVYHAAKKIYDGRRA
jgi:hypothetical protein